MAEPTGIPHETNFTALLSAAADGDQRAAAEVLPLVYDELRRLAASHMAGQPAGHTLNATALVHEAYLKLVRADDAVQQQAKWAGRRHFLAAAAQAMRSILVDRARRRASLKRGGGRAKLELTDDPAGVERDALELMAVDDALRRMEQVEPRRAQIVSLRYFAGLSVEETAEALDLSPATVKNEWLFARAWLHRELTGEALR